MTSEQQNKISLPATTTSISILLLGDSLTEGYTQHGTVFHPYGIQLKKRFEEAGKDVEVKKLTVFNKLFYLYAKINFYR